MDTTRQPSAAPKSSSDIWQDPIVEEIHEHRAQLAKRFDYDLQKLFAYYREGENRNPSRRANLAPSRPVGSETS